ncbi:UV DNA damage endonuclease [Bacillus sp. THAF10]|uniref:UV DNA damage repair endonuclease UvsE n=1 Tax=Bacillus sp. THAF10 TaxID=2587848 RepID=UPI001268BCCA|nr:UV DNA damage repair endonuclease UvsE [Bacillus sp. THAF10]QFT90972.1 UV DNA damage endonuclease [Bacillus sp. THAF10]
MRIRVGFVSQSMSLWEASPARALTFTRYQQMEKKEGREKLLAVTKENLQNTLRTIYYCIAHDIKVFRLSSSIVPLATHPEVKWDFVTPFKKEFQEIGDLIKRYGMRSSFHPNQFTLFTSDKPHITENAVIDMVYHYEMLKAMGLEKEGTINIHVGGAYGNKELALERFKENIKQLPDEVRKRMTLENDDKTYTTEETLGICEELGIPLAFDYHHEYANPSAVSWEELLPRVYATWKDIGIIPKIHISSPLSEKKLRHHSDFVDLSFVMEFLKVVVALGEDVDFMVEAKRKDEAALQLVEEMANIRGVKRMSGGSIEW